MKHRDLIDDYAPTFPTRLQLFWLKVCRFFRWWPFVTRRRLKRTDAYWLRLHDREMGRMSDEICRLRRALLSRRST
jgi:hypothetical protein